MQYSNEPYNTTTEQLQKALNTGESGLTSQDAAALLALGGANVLAQGHKKTLFSIVLSQFKNLMIIVLLAAGIISAIFGEGISDAHRDRGRL